MSLLSIIELPGRLGAAMGEVTAGVSRLVSEEGPIRREGGYGDQLHAVVADAGLLEQLADIARPGGLLDDLKAFALIFSPQNTVGRAFAVGGTIVNAVARDGLLDRMTDPNGPIVRLLAKDGALDQLTKPNGALVKLLENDGILDRLMADGGAIEHLVEAGGTIDQLLALTDNLAKVAPTLDVMSNSVNTLQDTVGVLSGAVEPLSNLIDRLPGRLRGSRAAVIAIEDE